MLICFKLFLVSVPFLGLVASDEKVKEGLREQSKNIFLDPIKPKWEACRTSLGEAGRCLPLADCPRLRNYVEGQGKDKLTELVSDFGCGFRKVVLICCRDGDRGEEQQHHHHSGEWDGFSSSSHSDDHHQPVALPDVFEGKDTNDDRLEGSENEVKNPMWSAVGDESSYTVTEGDSWHWPTNKRTPKYHEKYPITALPPDWLGTTSSSGSGFLGVDQSSFSHGRKPTTFGEDSVFAGSSLGQSSLGGHGSSSEFGLSHSTGSHGHSNSHGAASHGHGGGSHLHGGGNHGHGNTGIFNSDRRPLDQGFEGSRPSSQGFSSGFGNNERPLGSSRPDSEGFGSSRPISEGFGSSRPIGEGFGSSRPISEGFGSSRPIGEEFGSSRPINEGFGSSRPIGEGFGSSRPDNVGFGSSRPISEGFGSSRPISEGFGSSRPDNVGFGSSRPISEGFGSSRPISEGFGSSRPGSGGFGGSRPDNESFGSSRPSSGGSSSSSSHGSGLFNQGPLQFENERPSRKPSGGSNRPTSGSSGGSRPSGGHGSKKPGGSGRRRLLPDGNCGTEITDKIIGGDSTKLDEFPWMALLHFTTKSGQDRGYGCGGSLINERYVLTAAHCIKGSSLPPNVVVNTVRLGEYDLTKERDCVDGVCSPTPLDAAVEEIIVHPEYKPGDRGQFHDIALIRLRERVPFGTYISPICLPGDEHKRKNFKGKQLTVAGWGKTSNGANGKSSAIKQKVNLPFVTLEDCKPFYDGINIRLRNTQMCAGGERDKDSCQGDSGGPLMSNDLSKGQSSWFVTGIVSFGPEDCGVKNIAGVYTKVSEYVDWILDNMRD